jgi:hypothetical protein
VATSTHMTPRTAVDDELAARQESVRADPERASVISAARRFKASWFELGELLTSTRQRERWRAWGYASFEDYCKKELHLRRETADKLTGSFTFLRARAPDTVERALGRDDGGRAAARDGSGRFAQLDDDALPSYQAVDFWRRADEADAPRDTLREIERQVLDEGVSAARLQRQFREVVFPLDDATREHKRRSELRAAVGRLVELLAHGRADGLVPDELSAELEEPLQRLAQLVAST